MRARWLKTCALMMVACAMSWGSAVAEAQSGTPAASGAPAANADAAVPAEKPAAAMSREGAFALGRQDTQRLYAGDTEPLWAVTSAKMRDGLKSEGTMKKIAAQVKEQLGAETEVLHEDAMPVPPTYQAYTRIVRVSKYPAPVVVMFAFGDGGSIEGFSVRPEPNPAPSEFLGYKDKTVLRWPLEGAWTVYQGGRTVAVNYHAAFADERFAYDIVRLENDGMFRGDGTKNEDWFSFGKPALAAAAGTVVKAVNEYEDNPPSKPSATSPKYGNTVVIDHGNGEWSMYAHLKRGSLLVKVGDKVKAGQVIAAVGNSGNSPLSHLHYHLQNTAEWFNGQGLPAVFHHVSVNGKAVEAAEPVRGETVEPR